MISTLDIWTSDVTKVQLLPQDEINAGSLAEQGLCWLLKSGEISEHQKVKFISSVKDFWISVHKYSTSKLPFNDEVIINSQWIDFSDEVKASLAV